MHRFDQLLLTAGALTLLSVTPLTAAQVSAPYVEDFESLVNCTGSCNAACDLTAIGWANSTTDQANWIVDSGGTNSFETGPSTDHSEGTAAGKYLYVEASSPCFPNRRAVLDSPLLDLTGMTSPIAGFHFHMWGDSMGTLKVDVVDDMGAVLQADAIPPFADNLNEWQASAAVDLTPFIPNGSVRLRFTGMVGSSFNSDMAVDNFVFREGVPDAAALSIKNTSACGGKSITKIHARVGAGALSPSIASVDAELRVDGVLLATETIAGPIPPSGLDYTFVATADLSAPGDHTISVSILFPGDPNPVNDVVSKTISIGSGNLMPFPYAENFDADDGGWVTSGDNVSWAHGISDAENIRHDSGAWSTNLSGYHNYSELSYVTMPGCVDFSETTHPVLRMTAWWDIDKNRNGAALEYTTDGSTWINLGAIGAGVDWYNTGNIPVQFSILMGWGNQPRPATHSALRRAQLPLDFLAGQGSVQFRAVFVGRDQRFDGIARDGFLFDDFVLEERTADEFIVRRNELSPTNDAAIAVGADAELVSSFSLWAHVANPSVTAAAITLTQTGSAADSDIERVQVWRDDGDGFYNPPRETLVAEGTLTSAVLTIGSAGTSLFNVGRDRAIKLWLTVDVADGATRGNTVAFDIVTPATDIILSAGATETISADGSTASDPRPIVSKGTLPFSDDFSAFTDNRSTPSTNQEAPEATAAGEVVTLERTNGPGAVRFARHVRGVVARTGELAVFDNPLAGYRAAALEYSFDLSTLSAVTDTLWFEIWHTDFLEQDDTLDNVFASVDGGATWAASILKFDGSTESNAFRHDVVDLSAALVAAGVDYSDDVVIRIQSLARDHTPTDGLIVDRVSLGRPPIASVLDAASTTVADASIVDFGDVGATSQSVMYGLSNAGQAALVVSALTSANETNVSNVTISMLNTTAILGGSAAEPFQIDYDAGEGAFSFDVNIAVNDPTLGDGIYTFTVSGTGNATIPEIDITDGGASIANGSSIEQGMLAANTPTSLGYNIENIGFADLSLMTVSIANAANVNASASIVPDSTIAVRASSPLSINFSVLGAGTFSFDVLVTSDDSDESPYIITITGSGPDEPPVSGGPDGGTGDGGTGDGGTGIAGGSGCGCRVGSKPERNVPTLLVGVFASMWWRRRRQR